MNGLRFLLARRWYDLAGDISWFIASHLPKRVCSMVFSRMLAVATSGKYSATVIPELSAIDCHKRFIEDDYQNPSIEEWDG